MRMGWIEAPHLLLSILLVACGRDEPAPTEPAIEPARSAAATRWVAVVRPEDRSILESPAVVRAAADSVGDVAVTVRARVVRVHARPGTQLDVDAPVLDVAPAELLDAAAEYVGTGRRLGVHAERAKRLEALRAEGLVDRERVFEQLAMVAELRAVRDRAAATLLASGVDPRRARIVARRGYLTLRAPVAGIVTEVNARPGEIREPGGRPFARIVGTAPARVEVRTTAPWPLASEVRFEALDGRSFSLSPTPLATVLDPDDGTRLSWFAPRDEPLRLRDGVRGLARLTASPEVWEVPLGAVSQRTGVSWLIRRREGEVSEVAVEVVAASGASALVVGPIREHDEVAADFAAYRQAEGLEGEAS